MGRSLGDTCQERWDGRQSFTEIPNPEGGTISGKKMVSLPLDTLIWRYRFDIKLLEIGQQNYGLDLLIWDWLATNCSQVTGMFELTLEERRARAARGKDGALGACTLETGKRHPQENKSIASLVGGKVGESVDKTQGWRAFTEKRW